jgi:hypothetical protein
MQAPLIIADGHVHIHECFDFRNFLDQALNNFRREAGRPFSGLLFLTDIKAKGGFLTLRKELAEKGRQQSLGPWTIQATGEDISLAARLTPEERLFLIAGRQLKTAEGLEVLALGTLDQLEDGHPLISLVQQIILSGGLPVIPWGVGKWFGARGVLVKNIIEENEILPLFLGDNGNRPLFWPRPNYFELAEKKGILLLPGSDPLPFPSEIVKIGRFGFKISGSISINPEYPGRDIKKLLLDPDTKPEKYGALEKPLRFFRNQLKMNWPSGSRPGH